MRTAATKLSGQEYDKLREYAEAQQSTVSAVLRELVQGATEGPVEPRPRDMSNKIPYCPKCGYLMFYYFARSEMACPKCGYYFEIDEPQWQRGEAIKI